MGSLIYLRLGGLELDWGKNSFFNNHSALFARDDVRMAPYYYADDNIEEKPAFARRLGTMIRRLIMLGFTLQACESLYDEMREEAPRFYHLPS